MTPEQFLFIRTATLDLTQAEMARLLGYGQQVRISEIENGKAAITPTVERLMAAYRDGYRPADWKKEA